VQRYFVQGNNFPEKKEVK